MPTTSAAPITRGAIVVGFAWLAVLIAAVIASNALATSLPVRTSQVSTTVDGAPANGASSDVVLSSTGRVVGFDTTATNLTPFDTNGPIRDVITLDLATNARRLISDGGNGASYTPTLSANGQRVVFASDATNLTPGDTNGVADLFLRDGGQPIIRLTTVDGRQANGPSFQPELSADGQRLIFASDASNLVPNDTNGTTDVFVQNLANGQITRINTAAGKNQANGRSSQPAISADGHWAAFASAASNLVKGDTNKVSDVFVKNLDTGAIDRVSLNSLGRQQNRAVSAPFTQISDISDDGRYVVFDSDATNLYPQDTNKHTDVFLRDRKFGVTTLVSASSFNVEGNNDSFAPSLTPNGRFISFQSFATNLAPGDGPREDIFLRDLKQGATSVVNVTADGSARGPELVSQLLQRPAIASTGKTAAFSSTVANLTPGDTNGLQDVFIRQMDAPVARVTNGPKTSNGRVRLSVVADDPLARSFVCQIDVQKPFSCGPDVNVRRNSGRNLRIRAGGLGTLFSDPLKISITNDHKRPSVSFTTPKRALRVLSGHAKDSSGISAVQVSVVYYFKGTTCKYLATPTQFKSVPCFFYRNAPFFKATGGRNWRLKLPKTIRGPLLLRAKSVDQVGNVSATRNLTVTVS